MRRIAYASPINPAPSGISDYSEELLPFLAQYAQITIYVDDGLKPENADLAHQFAIRPLSRLVKDHRRTPYDAVIYHMGNSPVHAQIWRALQQVPGIVVLHEWVLHHFMLNYAATVERNIQGYAEEAAARYGEQGAHIARLMLHGRFTEAAFTLPFNERVLAQAQGVIAHSAYVHDRVLAARPDLPCAVVPMGVPLPPTSDRLAARARLGLPADAFILASFGHINPYKRLEATMRAVQQLRSIHPATRYILVGSVSPNYDVRAVAERSGLGDAVTVTGYVGRAAFEDYVAAADVCVNLRHPTAGETSASLLRLLGAGRPTLVTASGSFTELPPDVAAQVEPDASEGDLITAYCHLFAARPDIAAQLGANARAFVAREHSLEQAAAGYWAFLAERYGWEQGVGGQGWGVGGRGSQDTTSTQAQTIASAEPHTIASAEPHTITSAEPHTIVPTDTLAGRVADAVVGIGGTEQDTALLRTVAQAAGELRLADDSKPAPE